MSAESQLSLILTNQDIILRGINQLLIQEKSMATIIDTLTAQVAAQTTVEQSAITLLNGLTAALNAALANNDTAALTAIVQQLNADQLALQAAITANTPPPAPIVPPPAPQLKAKKP